MTSRSSRKISRIAATILATIGVGMGFSVPGIASEKSDLQKYEQVISDAIEENTESPTALVGEGTVRPDSSVETKEDIEIAVNPSKVRSLARSSAEVPEVKVVERADGVQLVAILTVPTQNEIRYKHEGKYLELAPTGHVIIADAPGVEPDFLVDPAWAQDSEGNPVETEYRIEGDTLIQTVGPFEEGVAVVADPYYRNSVVWGNFPTSDLVFSPDETRNISYGGTACTFTIGGYVPAAGVVCGAVSLYAQHARDNGRCLAIRNIYLPGTSPADIRNDAPHRRVMTTYPQVLC